MNESATPTPRGRLALGWDAVTSTVWRIWDLAKSGIGGLYVLIGIAGFFGYSELTQIKVAVERLTPDPSRSISEILDVASDSEADTAARASSRAYNLFNSGQKPAARDLMRNILAVLEGLNNTEGRQARAWLAIGIFRHQDVGVDGVPIINAADIEANRLAIEAYNNGIDLDSSNVAIYVNRGIAHDVLGQYEEAERDYSIAIRLQPEEHGAYFQRGELRFRLSRQNDARLDLERALFLARTAEDVEMVRRIVNLLERLQ